MKQKLLHTLYPIEKVDLRNVFPSEVSDFTPWLTQEENLEMLNETLGLDIEIVATEKGINGKIADMVGVDRKSGRKVVIENQLTKFDDDHLGKALAYRAGIDASIIIWIAKEYSEAHKTALGGLNETSIEGYDYFGVEISALKVGENHTTDFRIRVQPNNWKKSVKSKSKSFTRTPISPELKYKRENATELLDGQTFIWNRSGLSVTIKDGGYYCNENDTTYDSMSEAFRLPYKEVLDQNGEEIGCKLSVNVWKTPKNADGQTPDQALDEVVKNKSK